MENTLPSAVSQYNLSLLSCCHRSFVLHSPPRNPSNHAFSLSLVVCLFLLSSLHRVLSKTHMYSLPSVPCWFFFSTKREAMWFLFLFHWVSLDFASSGNLPVASFSCASRKTRSVPCHRVVYTTDERWVVGSAGARIVLDGCFFLLD